MNYRHFCAAAIAAITLLGAQASADIVYMDSFGDGATGTNTDGIGGGLNATSRNGGTLYAEDGMGNLTASTNFGSHQSAVWTQNQFDLSDGFNLTVDFTTVAAGNPSFTFGFGLVDEVVGATTGNGGDFGNTGSFGSAENSEDGLIAFATTDRNGFQGLNTDFGTLATETNALDGALTPGTSQTFNLTVNADGSGSAVLGGSSFAFAAGDLSGFFSSSSDGEYHFVLFAQGNNDPGGSLQSVTIDAFAVPEPTSLAVLGLGFLGFVTRRRR